MNCFFECKHFETLNAEGGKIGDEHIKCIFKATRSWPHNTLALMYKEMEAIMTTTLNDYYWLASDRDTLRDRFIKEALLSMQGSWLTQHRYVYDITDSTHSEDVNKQLYSFRTLKDGTTRFASRTEILQTAPCI